MSKQMLDLAKGLREAAHYCTELSELEKHCNDIAGKLDSMARQCSAVSAEPVALSDDALFNIATEAWSTQTDSSWSTDGLQAAIAAVLDAVTHPAAAAPSASATPGAASDVDEMIERMNRALAKADLEAERADNIENEFDALKAQKAPSASVREAEQDAARYRRLRVLGVAPCYTEHLSKGEVLRFTNLDGFVDADIKTVPSRGEALSEPAPAPDHDAGLPTANDVRGILGPAKMTILTNPEDTWDAYCAEVAEQDQSPQGAMAFAIERLSEALNEPAPAQERNK